MRTSKEKHRLGLLAPYPARLARAPIRIEDDQEVGGSLRLRAQDHVDPHRPLLHYLSILEQQNGLGQLLR